jgi:hypothetical protein
MPPPEALSSALLRRGVGSVSIKGRDVTAAPAVNIDGDLNILDPPAAAARPPAEGTLPLPTLAPPPTTAGSPPPVYGTTAVPVCLIPVVALGLINRDPALTKLGANLNAARPADPMYGSAAIMGINYLRMH